MQLSRRQIIAYVAVAAVVVAVGVRYVVLPRQAGPSEAQAVVLAPVSASASPAAAESAGAAASPAPDVVVYVCGAVRSPGVVRLPAGARVTDALELAGGPTAGAELAAVNLAAPVTDGQQIVVPERGAPAVATAPARPVLRPALRGPRRQAPRAPARSSTSTRPRSRSSTRSMGSGRPPRRRSSTTARPTAASRPSRRSRRSRASGTPSSRPCRPPSPSEEAPCDCPHLRTCSSARTVPGCCWCWRGVRRWPCWERPRYWPPARWWRPCVRRLSAAALPSWPRPGSPCSSSAPAPCSAQPGSTPSPGPRWPPTPATASRSRRC